MIGRLRMGIWMRIGKRGGVEEVEVQVGGGMRDGEIVGGVEAGIRGSRWGLQLGWWGLGPGLVPLVRIKRLKS